MKVGKKFNILGELSQRIGVFSVSRKIRATIIPSFAEFLDIELVMSDSFVATKIDASLDVFLTDNLTCTVLY